MHPLHVVVLLFTLLFSTVQSPGVQHLYFKPGMSRNKHKSSGDVTGTTVLSRYYRLNVFFFLFAFIYYLYEKYNIINLLQHSTKWQILLVG